MKLARPGKKDSWLARHSAPRHMHPEKSALSPISNPEKSISSLGDSEKSMPAKVT